MSRKNQKKKDAKRIKKDSASIRGIERKEHFESGKTLAQWRGTHAVHTSRAEKKRTRSSDKKNAIDDSKDN